MSCQNARALVPSYLDAELSEEQAAPLRAHLLACLDCRESAKRGTRIKRWFSQALAAHGEEQLVPEGFAARVARRAFAGDPGVFVPHPEASEPVGTLLPFVLKLSALAACLLFAFSIGIRMAGLPSGAGMDALEKQPWELQEYPADWDAGSAASPASAGPADQAQPRKPTNADAEPGKER